MGFLLSKLKIGTRITMFGAITLICVISILFYITSSVFTDTSRQVGRHLGSMEEEKLEQLNILITEIVDASYKDVLRKAERRLRALEKSILKNTKLSQIQKVSDVDVKVGKLEKGKIIKTAEVENKGNMARVIKESVAVTNEVIAGFFCVFKKINQNHWQTIAVSRIEGIYQPGKVVTDELLTESLDKSQKDGKVIERYYYKKKVYIRVFKKIWVDGSDYQIGYVHNIDHIPALTKALHSFKIGKSGYYYILGADPQVRGFYLMSMDGKRDWENIIGAKDSDGKLFIKDMVETAEKSSKAFKMKYPWKNKGEKTARVKIAVISFYKPLGWVIGASSYYDDMEKVTSSLNKSRKESDRKVLFTGLTILFLGVLGCIYIGWMISKPIRALTFAIGEIAEGDGDLTKRLDVSGNDEIAEMSKSFNKFISNLAEIIRTLIKSSGILDKSKNDLSGAFNDLSGNIDDLQQKTGIAAGSSSQLESDTSTVATATAEVSASLSSAATGTEQIRDSIKDIFVSASSMASSISTIASSVEELTVSLSEVSHNFAVAASNANTSNERAKEAEEQMTVLSKSARDIAKVTDLINDIANQTNLLALNATIEAASAGEAGRGFTVVAQEIKQLAKQTAGATKEIGSEIERMQQVTERAVEIIREVGLLISRVSEMNNAVAAAVEEQSATVSELAGNITSGAHSADSVSSMISVMSDAAKDVTEKVADIEAGANEIQTTSKDLANSTAIINNVIKDIDRITGMAREQSLSVDKAAGEISDSVDNIKNLIIRFKV